jgi:hypothetical protein
VKLLTDVDAGSTLLDHADDRLEVALRAAEALEAPFAARSDEGRPSRRSRPQPGWISAGEFGSSSWTGTGGAPGGTAYGLFRGAILVALPASLLGGGAAVRLALCAGSLPGRGTLVFVAAAGYSSSSHLLATEMLFSALHGVEPETLDAVVHAAG